MSIYRYCYYKPLSSFITHSSQCGGAPSTTAVVTSPQIPGTAASVVAGYVFNFYFFPIGQRTACDSTSQLGGIPWRRGRGATTVNYTQLSSLTEEPPLGDGSRREFIVIVQCNPAFVCYPPSSPPCFRNSSSCCCWLQLNLNAAQHVWNWIFLNVPCVAKLPRSRRFRKNQLRQFLFGAFSSVFGRFVLGSIRANSSG